MPPLPFRLLALKTSRGDSSSAKTIIRTKSIVTKQQKSKQELRSDDGGEEAIPEREASSCF